MLSILFMQKYRFAEFWLNQVKHRPNFTRSACYRIHNVSRKSEQKIGKINFKNVLLTKRTSNRSIIRSENTSRFAKVQQKLLTN